jgi:hypothetical protein
VAAAKQGNAAVEGYIVDLAVQPPYGVLNAGKRPILLHHIVKVDKPIGTLMERRDLPAVIGVGPKVRGRIRSVEHG